MSTRGTITKPVRGSILVIDDDEIALQAITDVLEHGGYKVRPLSSPVGATQVIATQAIVAAVIDLNMPVMRGDRFIALVRSWDRIRDLPIVLLSGESSQLVREAAAQLQGVAVVTKTQMSERLVPTLDHALLGKPMATPKLSLSASPHPGRPVEISRAAHAQRATGCLSAWRDFALTRTDSSPLTGAIAALRDELRLQNMQNSAQLLSSALEIVQLCDDRGQIPVEADNAVVELFAHLATTNGERLRTFERSLALDIQRSRLERARQQLLQ